MHRINLALVSITLFLAVTAQAQGLRGTDLIEALQGGGYVLVMRHASSPSEPPDAASAQPDNVTRERQLDEEGRRTANAMGEALRRLQIPISQVLSSPSYRTLETARLLGFGEAETRGFLGNQGMQAAGEAVGARLRSLLVNWPGQGNRLLITHSPNVAAGWPALEPTIAQGEVLVFPAGGEFESPVARIKIEEWMQF